MAEPDHDLARAVDALRSERSPPAGSQARVRALLDARLGDAGSGDPGPDDPGVGPSTAGSGVFAAKVVAAIVALTGGGLIALKLGVLALRSLDPSGGSAPVDPIEQIDPIEQVATVQAPQQAQVPRPEPEPRSGESTKVVGLAPPLSVAASPRPTPTALAVNPAALEPDISAELELLDAARRAATPEAAITQLRAHASRFPQGALRDERDALWAIASCELEDLRAAASKYSALSARRPNSPLLDRIAQVCPTLEQ